LGFPDIIKEQVMELAPLERIASRENTRVDPRTSAWIMGKLLKLLTFTHDHGVTSTITGENILINKNEHFVALFDWSNSLQREEPLSGHVAAGEIAAAAKEVIKALGGNPDTGELPQDDQLPDVRYEAFLWNLACEKQDNAHEAHQGFYRLVDELWPKGFHPYAAYPLE
jgi:hypothetical protein